MRTGPNPASFCQFTDIRQRDKEITISVTFCRTTDRKTVYKRHTGIGDNRMLLPRSIDTGTRAGKLPSG